MANFPGEYFQAQKVEWEQPAQIHQGYLTPDKPDGSVLGDEWVIE